MLRAIDHLCLRPELTYCASHLKGQDRWPLISVGYVAKVCASVAQRGLRRDEAVQVARQERQPWALLGKDPGQCDAYWVAILMGRLLKCSRLGRVDSVLTWTLTSSRRSLPTDPSSKRPGGPCHFAALGGAFELTTHSAFFSTPITLLHP